MSIVTLFPRNWTLLFAHRLQLARKNRLSKILLHQPDSLTSQTKTEGVAAGLLSIRVDNLLGAHILLLYTNTTVLLGYHREDADVIANKVIVLNVG